jgi:hypothetical protein
MVSASRIRFPVEPTPRFFEASFVQRHILLVEIDAALDSTRRRRAGHGPVAEV